MFFDLLRSNHPLWMVLKTQTRIGDPPRSLCPLVVEPYRHDSDKKKKKTTTSDARTPNSPTVQDLSSRSSSSSSTKNNHHKAVGTSSDTQNPQSKTTTRASELEDGTTTTMDAKTSTDGTIASAAIPSRDNDNHKPLRIRFSSSSSQTRHQDSSRNNTP